jgi:acyl-CoA dehydrogenase
MVLHIAYKMERGLDIRQENSIAKNYIALMLNKVVDVALQIHGSLGFTHDTPLAEWYQEVRAQRLIDGPDEVHRWRVGRNVLDAYRRAGSTAPAAGGDIF